MTDQEQSGSDKRRMLNIALAAVATLVAGAAIGWAIAGTDPAPPATTVAAAGSTTIPDTGPTTTTPPATPPSTEVPGQITLVAAEDTYTNEEQPAEINGVEDLIEVENDPPEIKRGLVRFDVTGIPEGETIRSATMRLYSVDDSDDAVAVHLVDGPWNQAETNAENGPAIGDLVATIPAPLVEAEYVEIDLTSVVTSPGQYDFYLIPSGDDTVEFASLENTANPPTLVVRWLEGPVEASQSLIGDPVSLVGAGGISDCGDGAAATAALVDDAVEASPQTIVFTTGDNVTDGGSDQAFADCYEPTWGSHLARTRPAVGDREYETTNATGYFGYFGEAAGEATAGYYSYAAGDWDVFVLNSNCSQVGGCGADSPQGQWLAAGLDDSDARCTAAYWHHGLFSSGNARGDDAVRPLVQLLYDRGAEVILTGHDQIYERFAQQDPTGLHDPVGGIRQFMVGAGGSGAGGIGDLAPNSETRYNGSNGVLQLDLYANGYEWEFTPEPGSDFADVGIGFCT